MIVRHVWWRLAHPETGGMDSAKTGTVTEIVVECEPALGPWSSDEWRGTLAAARERGVRVEEFDIARLTIRQEELP